MRRVILMLAMSVMLAWAGGAWAASSLVGPTGLLRTPTADVLAMTQFTVGLTQVWADAGEDETILYANLGLLPKTEVGFTRLDLQDADSETVINAKVRLLGPLPGRVSLAGGVIDLTDQIDRSFYLVASHSLGAGVLTEFGQVKSPQLHVGIGGGQLDGLFAGLSATVRRGLVLMAEYDGDDMNFGVRLPVAPHVEATAAALAGFDDLALGVQFSSPW